MGVADRYPTGLIVGRFLPPHLGHSLLIRSAAARAERVAVLVNTRAGEVVPGELRVAWLAELHPDVTVVHNDHDLDTDWSDETLWSRWIALFRRRWPFEVGPHAVFSSETYGDELARRLGAVAVVVDAERVAVPVSGTMIRERPLDLLHHLAPPVRAWVAAHADDLRRRS